MKIILPESINDITLFQFQQYDELLKREDLDEYNFNKRKIQIFTGIERNRIDLVSSVDYKMILTQIDLALNQTVEFKPTFFIKDVEFGFIPNFDKITQDEFIDISTHGVSVESMHKLMAVLFRPIKNKDVLGNYEIIKYKGTKQYSDIMKHMPLSIVNGSLVFFSSLANELINYTQKYMTQGPVREKQQTIISKSGGGMLQLRNWLKEKFGK